jgi:hypothetical protein
MNGDRRHQTRRKRRAYYYATTTYRGRDADSHAVGVVTAKLKVAQRTLVAFRRAFANHTVDVTQTVTP